MDWGGREVLSWLDAGRSSKVMRWEGSMLARGRRARSSGRRGMSARGMFRRGMWRVEGGVMDRR